MRRHGPTGLYTILQKPPMCSYSFTIAISRGSPRAEERIMKGRVASFLSIASVTGVGSSFTTTMSPISSSSARGNCQSVTRY